ncbi:argininosuccinate lyase [Halorubellus sp. JP-L1]|uniref:argininosuccinate lyase n=1 Tax=Halorubellus sp. JP-L1 TaxID=2715753 RepID=UPI00140C6A7C|nr:argininosuccinate lyase [Halorubellus sp. JP-L1]NHN43330.1 argininosuccinate lyase [Halorubellus sp. JP-L1]
MTEFRDNRTAAGDSGGSGGVGDDGVGNDGSTGRDGSGDGASGRGATDGGTAVRGERFSGGPARGFMSSLAGDERIFEADLAVDRAHVVMLAEQGVVSDDEAGQILQALNVVEVEEHQGLPDGEDVHEAIESKVIAIAGSVGGKMHTARSRNDEVAACIRYRLREDVLAALAAVNDARAALVEVADAEGETLMPGYTHLQSAQPTTVGHWALSYAGALARDADRLLDAYERVNESPLGAAAFAGTPFDVDRERTAELLGFSGLVTNATDAVAARDHLVEVASALANVATHLSGLAEDLVIFSSRGFVALDDAYASTSSIMPQKKNPDTLELVRATAGDASAGLNGLLSTLKGLPRAYNRDLQRATPHVWSAVDAVTEATEVAAGAVATADWPSDALAEAAGEGFATATAVADVLAMAGVPFRQAHEVVATASERSTAADDADGAGGSADGDAPSVETIAAAVADVLGEPMESFVDAARVADALDPAANVAMRDSVGGPAPDAVASQVASAADALSGDESAVAAKRDALELAHETLQDEVSTYV